MGRKPSIKELSALISSCRYREVADMMLELCDGGDRASMPNDAADVFIKLIGNKRNEHFAVMFLNGSHKVIDTKVVSSGTINRAIISPAEVFRPAIIADAVAVIVAHNHPSGNLSPSNEDMDVTKRMGEAGKLIGINMLDHIIVSHSSYYSILDNGGMV